MFPLSGGVVRFPHLAFGSFASFTLGLDHVARGGDHGADRGRGDAAVRLPILPFTEASIVGGEDGAHADRAGLRVAVVLMALFVLINYFGVKWFARVNNALVWWKIAVILLVIVAFLLTPSTARTSPSHGFAPSRWPRVFTAIATSGIVFSFLGFRQGIELAGETDNPKRNVPIAVVGSVLITGVIYVLLQFAFIGSLPPGVLDKSAGPS